VSEFERTYRRSDSGSEWRARDLWAEFITAAAGGSRLAPSGFYHHCYLLGFISQALFLNFLLHGSLAFSIWEDHQLIGFYTRS
jgi:hypothetical protein